MFELYLLNLIIVVGMFGVTIYRAWLEKKQLTAQEQIRIIRAILESEKDIIKELSGEEFIEMLEAILK